MVSKKDREAAKSQDEKNRAQEARDAAQRRTAARRKANMDRVVSNDYTPPQPPTTD